MPGSPYTLKRHEIARRSYANEKFSNGLPNRQFVDRSRSLLSFHPPLFFPLPLSFSPCPSKGWSVRRSRNNTKKIKPWRGKGRRGVHPSWNTVGYCFEARWPISYRPYVDGHGVQLSLSPLCSILASPLFPSLFPLCSIFVSLFPSPTQLSILLIADTYVYTHVEGRMRRRKRSQWPATTPKQGLCAALIMGG